MHSRGAKSPNRPERVHQTAEGNNTRGVWTDFTNCMSAVMKIIEGAAYYPEASETFEISPKTGFHGYADVNKPPASDDGTTEVNI